MSENQQERKFQGWPVVHERPLLRAERRLWRRFRSPDFLPILQPGCVYVFAGGGRHEVCANGADLRGDEPMFVDASSVSVVAMRFRRMWVWIGIPTTEIATSLQVGVTFGCQVVDPGVIASNGLTDLRGELASRVRYERALLVRRHRFAPDDLVEASKDLVDALETQYRNVPLKIDGMIITFEGAVVNLPSELLRHRKELRNTRWAHVEHQHKHMVERERVEHLERDLLSSPERSEATAIVRDERSVDQAAARQFEARDAQTERLIDHVRDWLGSDAAKRAPVDRRQMAEALFARLTQTPSGNAAAGHPPTGIVELVEPWHNGQVAANLTGYIAPEDPDDG